MAAVIAEGDAGHVWLDATALGRDLLENGFPTVTAACRKHGIDPVTELIPVAPGAHYSCGGILAGLDGRTSLAGLYAAGEAASTGVQGANRLASNSVTEAVIAGRRAGAAIAASLSAAAAACAPPRVPGATARAVTPPGGPQARTAATQAAGGASEPAGNGAAARRFALAQAMSRYAGVIRDADGLARLLRTIAETGDEPGSVGALAGASDPAGLDLEAVEAANLRVVSMLIAVGARRRKESRGCHRRSDAAGPVAAPWHTLARWDGYRLTMTQEAL
jgi:L-aspartate oxidase